MKLLFMNVAMRYHQFRLTINGCALQCCEVIEDSLTVARNLASDVHLYVLAFNEFGKGLIKTFRMSPDAFIQAALQLAHYRVRNLSTRRFA